MIRHISTRRASNTSIQYQASQGIRRVGLRVTGALLLLSGGLVCAQQASAPAFEVASIKPADPNERRIMMRGDRGTVNLTGVTLTMLVQQAYDVRDFQISGGPGWMNSDRYNIIAKVPANAAELPADPTQATDEQRQTFQKQRAAMVQSLLAERFQLKVHHETRELPVYVLTVAKNGPKIKDNGGKTADPNIKPGMIRMGPGQLFASQSNVTMLAQLLSQSLGRTVIDKTGLTGKFDYELKWTPDPATTRMPIGPPPPGADGPPPFDPNGPDLFTAVQEQLGLKLESQKGPVDIVVVDHAEKPSEN